MPNPAPFRRRHYFVKKDYQARFILRFCLIALAGALASTGLLLIFSQGTLTSSFQHSRLLVQTTSFAIMPAVIYTNAITLALILLATIVVVLFLSHKIAGPMFRFEKELQAIGQGDLSRRVRLREKDQFTDMAESLNGMTAGLGQRVRESREDLERIVAQARQTGASEPLLAALEELRAAMDRRFTV